MNTRQPSLRKPVVHPPSFIGDLSTQDAAVLATLAQGSDVLEFGAGGSTQIFAACAHSLVSVETEAHWIAVTQRNLDRIAPPIDVSFLGYDPGAIAEHAPYHVAFIDGKDELREDFASIAYRHVCDGGLLVFHDCRIPSERRMILRMFARFIFATSEIEFDVAGSNLAIMRKRAAAPYADWNCDEDRAEWEIGRDEGAVPIDWRDRVAARTDRFLSGGHDVPVPDMDSSGP